MKIKMTDRLHNAAVDYDDGQAVLITLRESLIEGESVELNFEGIDIFASPFFNGSLAQLVNEFGETFVQDNVKMVNLNREGQTIARRSIENAIALKDPETRKRLSAVLNEEDEGD